MAWFTVVDQIIFSASIYFSCFQFHLLIFMGALDLWSLVLSTEVVGLTMKITMPLGAFTEFVIGRLITRSCHQLIYFMILSLFTLTCSLQVFTSPKVIDHTLPIRLLFQLFRLLHQLEFLKELLISLFLFLTQ